MAAPPPSCTVVQRPRGRSEDRKCGTEKPEWEIHHVTASSERLSVCLSVASRPTVITPPWRHRWSLDPLLSLRLRRPARKGDKLRRTWTAQALAGLTSLRVQALSQLCQCQRHGRTGPPAWNLSGGSVGPPARWAATSNVEGGQTTYPVNRDRVVMEGR